MLFFYFCFILDFCEWLLETVSHRLIQGLPWMELEILVLDVWKATKRLKKATNSKHHYHHYHYIIYILFLFFLLIWRLKVFIESVSPSDSSFFTTWRLNCTKITCRKMYTQASMDAMLEPIPTSHNPQNKLVVFTPLLVEYLGKVGFWYLLNHKSWLAD